MDQFIEDEGKLGHGFTSADELEKIDLRDGSKPRSSYISAKLDSEYKAELIALLKEFKDCFAYEDYDMPSLDRCIVEHSRQCNQKIYPDIKAEIIKILVAGFIRQCRYVVDF
jgi:hypothetical protein